MRTCRLAGPKKTCCRISTKLARTPWSGRDDVGVLVPANSVIVFPNNHIHSIGREVKAQIEVGLTFHPKGFTPKYTRGMGFIEITGDRQLDIPGNTDDVRYDFFFTLTENRRMVNFEPHLHSSGKRMCQEVIYPSGHREMLNCARYSHNWVKVYSYEEDAAPLLPKARSCTPWPGTTTARRTRSSPTRETGKGWASARPMTCSSSCPSSSVSRTKNSRRKSLRVKPRSALANGAITTEADSALR